ncbi:MAG: LysR family transcriptional regulator [Pseudobacteriovorax sp.]|nr:LysR family transcriptional regulator [Pseudobacteriovorax sp.]
MKIDQLIYFAETAKQLHIGRAASILGITSSAVSHSIRSLENELGLELFYKVGRKIELTVEGERLLKKSESLISAFQNLKYDLLKENDDYHYFKIGVSHTLSHLLAGPVWAQLSAEYRKSRADVLSLRSAEVMGQVMSKQIDIGLLFSPQEQPDLEIEHLYWGQLRIVVGQHHPVLQLPKKDRYSNLGQYPAVLPKAFQGIDICHMNPMFSKHHIEVSPKTLIDNYEVAFSIIKNSNAWAFVPDVFIGDPFHNEIQFVDGEGDWDAPYSISIIWRKKTFYPKFYQDFKNAIQTLLSQR